MVELILNPKCSAAPWRMKRFCFLSFSINILISLSSIIHLPFPPYISIAPSPCLLFLPSLLSSFLLPSLSSLSSLCYCSTSLISLGYILCEMWYIYSDTSQTNRAAYKFPCKMSMTLTICLWSNFLHIKCKILLTLLENKQRSIKIPLYNLKVSFK